MNSKKIVLIGAESAMFTQGFVADLILSPDLGPWELGLVDVDPSALETAEGLSRRMVQAKGVDIAIQASTDRRDILSGADAVVSSIGVGGRRAWGAAGKRSEEVRRMYRWVWMSLLIAAVATTTSAETYYVATDGKVVNDGSKERPWHSVEYALSKVGGGHTIIVRPGIYRGPIQIAKQYAGTKEHPTVIKSEIKWKAVIIGAPYHVISNGDGCDWVVVDGFEVMGAHYDGIKMNGDYNVVRNCWVHNNSHMGIAMHNKKGGVIENNLIEFNGCHVHFHHGIYADGDRLTIRGNIVRHNAGFGLHLYRSIKNSVIANNLVYGHAYKSGIIVACPEGGGKNIVVNNTVVENNDGITIWHGNGEIVVNNIVMADDEVLFFRYDTKNVLVDYNLCVPKSELQGPHGITGDPLFVDAGRGAFWLRPSSPTIGRGTLEHAPSLDFWGRTLPKDEPPDLGAFAFVPFLATEQARAGWYYNWAYRYSPDAGHDMPDLWELPSSKEGK